MGDDAPAPNELADLYDGLFIILENLPEQTYPPWEFALESILFGGDGLAENATSYGEQQSLRNDFEIATYRDQYGDGNRVTEFPSIETGPPRSTDREFVTKPLELPVAPESNRVLPVEVNKDSFADAIALLAELQSEPTAQHSGNGSDQLLHPERFPGITQSLDSDHNQPESEAQSPTAGNSEEDDPLGPNQLADFYAGLQQVLNHVPEDGLPLWRHILESVVHGGDYLGGDTMPYGEQQATRNNFGMPTYRASYGDGDRVTEFPSVSTQQPRKTDRKHIDDNTKILVAPESEQVLLINPSADELPEAISRLGELPATPSTEMITQGESQPLRECLIGLPTDLPPTDPDNSAKPESQTDDRPQEEPKDGEVIRQAGPSEVSGSPTNDDHSRQTDEWKYDDPRAERAHRRALERDPSDVVELGEEITLVLNEVDYSSHPPTVMGTKEKLVIFVTEAPQDLSEHDIIRAKVIDFGGKRTSAEAVFLNYHD